MDQTTTYADHPVAFLRRYICKRPVARPAILTMVLSSAWPSPAIPEDWPIVPLYEATSALALEPETVVRDALDRPMHGRGPLRSPIGCRPCATSRGSS